MSDDTYYITAGPVRGECGHHHRTAQAALACQRRDQRACARGGGYSDRRVICVSPHGRSVVDPTLEDGRYDPEPTEPES